MPAILLLAATAIVAATAWTVALRVGLRTTAGVVLAAYLLAFGEIVVITLALSAVRRLDAWWLFGSVLICLVVVLAVTTRWPRSRTDFGGTRLLRDVGRDPVVVVLGGAVAAGLVYSAALMTLTPPNDWDAMTYQLARAAFWIQQHSVGYVPDSPEVRINGNPPNAEVGMLFTMLLSESDRFVGAVQYAALLASGVGVVGLSRRIGLDARGAAFGALVFMTLPVVLLQSSTALNDLVVASFLLAATYFLLGETRVELLLGGLALALAVGTKFTALLAVPLLATVVLLRQPRDRWLRVGAVFVSGVAAGSYWLVVNIVHTGSADGDVGDVLEQHPDRGLAETLARATRLAVGFADTMNLDRDALVYVIAAAAFASLALVLDGGSRRRRLLLGCAVAVVACFPLVLPAVRETLLRLHEKLWVAVGKRELAFLDPTRDPWSPSTTHSYYGPLGFALLAAGILVCAIAVRRGVVSRYSILLAAAPLVFVLVLAFALAYDPLRGRFFMFPVALAAATWGLMLPYRWLAWGSVSIAATTVVLSFAHWTEKPAGIALFEPSPSGVWGRPRAEVQTLLRGDGTADVIRFFGDEGANGRVALRVGHNDWAYPYFGPELSREVVFADATASHSDANWVVTSPSHRWSPRSGWSVALETHDGWRVYRRNGPP